MELKLRKPRRGRSKKADDAQVEGSTAEKKSEE
jgi:hypothetical protein